MSVPLQTAPFPLSTDKLPQASYLSGFTALLSGYAEPIGQYYDKLHQYRGVAQNPGNVESLGRDVKSESFEKESASSKTTRETEALEVDR